MPALRATVSLAAALLGAALIPGAAQAATGWQNGDANLAATINLTEVAASPGGVVVAVGKDSATGNAVIVRRAANGTWVQDQLNLPSGATSSDLADVAVSDAAAVAVGTYVDGSALTHPLVLRIAGGATAITSSSAATWAAPSGAALPDTVTPRAVALRASAGLVGVKVAGAYPSGAVYAYDDSTGFGATPAQITPTGPPAGPINAIAFFGDGQAYTAGDPPPDDPGSPSDGGANRIFQISPSPAPGGSPQMLPVATADTTPLVPIVGIGASSQSDAVAIEANGDGTNDPGVWTPSGPSWSRDTSSPAFTNASKPSDLSLAKPDASSPSVQAVAGQHSSAGAVWRRTGTGTWTRDDAVIANRVNAVAVIDATDIWAVGDAGAVVHFTTILVPAPDTSIDTGPSGETPDPMPDFTFSSTPSGGSFECSLDNTSFAACTSPKTLGPLDLGPHTLAVRARDTAGGVDLTPATRTFTVVPPETTIDSGPTGTIPTTGATFAFSSDLSSATFECSVDGGGFGGCSSPKVLSSLIEGDHTFAVRAVSLAGADPSPATSTFRVDLAKHSSCTQVPRPLVRNVVVRKRRHALVIDFDLAADSRVKAKAYHGTKLIGHTKAQLLRQGHHTMNVRIGGRRKPTQLKLLARPAAADACAASVN